MPPAANRRAQQRAFDRFRREYNQVRPHEALEMHRRQLRCYRVAAGVSGASAGAASHPSGMQVRRMQSTGIYLEAGARIPDRNLGGRARAGTDR